MASDTVRKPKSGVIRGLLALELAAEPKPPHQSVKWMGESLRTTTWNNNEDAKGEVTEQSEHVKVQGKRNTAG